MLPHSPLTPCGWWLSLWAVIGQRDEVEEWPPWQWHCIISDRGHRVRGERGLPDTTKKQTLCHELPAELSLIGQTFNPVYVFSKGVGSPSKLKLEGPEFLFFEQLEFLPLSFSNWVKQLVLEWVIHKREGLWRRESFMISSFSFLDSEKQKSLIDLREVQHR